MKPVIRIFDTPQSLAEALAADLEKSAATAKKQATPVNLALSGGSTPSIFFRLLAQEPYRFRIEWKYVRLFWGDERCVPPDHPDSNYGMTRKDLFDRIDIPPENLHRIRGEDDPEIEARRYEDEIREYLPEKNGLPVFDWIHLGLGADGHTASLFPEASTLNENPRLCAVAHHPQTGQPRITLTLPVINQARRVTFLVTGAGKSEIVEKIILSEHGTTKFPATLVRPRHGLPEWFLDRAAAAKF
jgi:6-phosphogluconolactonase